MKKVWNFIKRHKVLFIVLIIVGLLVAWIVSSSNAIKNQLPIVETSKIERENLINSVNVDGVVESAESKKIFTQLALPVKENMVEVGDSVKVGDVLCKLDPRTLEESIEQQKAALSAQEAVNSNSIGLAQKQMEFAKGDIAGGGNTMVLQAEQGLVAAEQQLNQAEVAFDNAVDTLQAYRKDQRDMGNGNSSNYADSDTQYKSFVGARDNAYASYESAKANVASAKESLAVAKKASTQQIEGYSDTINSSRIAAGATSAQWITVEHLEGELGRAEITSPIDGVVTAIYATEGSTATGLLFVVEDLDNLQIKAVLKEYDLADVKEGDKVLIKSDATGEEEYNGKLSSVAPTTTKTPTGDNKTEGTGEFETEISVDKAANPLKVGTKARVDIIYGQKDNVLTVPYEALSTNKEGKDVIYILEPSAEKERVYDVKEIEIEIGIEGDFKIEIASNNIQPGTIVVKNAASVPEGMKVHIMDDVAQLAQEGHVQAYLLNMEG